MTTRDAVLRIARFLVLTVLMLHIAAPAHAETVDWKARWVVDAGTALQLVEDGAAVLDTRGALAFMRGHLPGAVRVNWTDFSRSASSERGRLLPPAPLQAAIRAASVRADRPVVVVGDPPDDWGEDGRIVWMLRTAGHEKAVFVNGGHDALERAGAVFTMRGTKHEAGDFVVTASAFGASASDLRKDGVVLLDTREAREFNGSTPYGESRPGHVPGARNLHFKDLMNPDGTVFSAVKVRDKLKTLGASRSSDIIAYCTGGVRSGWLVAVLRSSGFSSVRNYAGSMWEWSARDAVKHPLETSE